MCGDLCGQGMDCTVFFMSVGDVYQPMGFTAVNAPVLQLFWTPDHYVSATVTAFTLLIGSYFQPYVYICMYMY